VVVRSLVSPDGSPLKSSAAMRAQSSFRHISLSPTAAGATPGLVGAAACSAGSGATGLAARSPRPLSGAAATLTPHAGALPAPVVDWALPSTERQPLSHTGALALFSMDMLQEVSRIRAETGIPVELRIGIHRGQAVGGVLGNSRPRYFLFGTDTVVANQMEATCIPGQIQVSAPAAVALHAEGFCLEPFQRVPTMAASLAQQPTAPSGGSAGSSSHGLPHAPSGAGAAAAAVHASGGTGSMETFLLRAYITPDGAAELLVMPPQPDSAGASRADA